MSLRTFAFAAALALTGQYANAEIENTGYFLCLEATNGACRPSYVADDMCDPVCNVQECNFDGGDCPETNPPTAPPTAPPTPPPTEETTSSPERNSEYRITVVFTNENLVTPAIRTAFENAVDRWSEVIIGDLPDITLSRPFSFAGCGASGSLPTGYLLDDLVIAASIENIDGPGSILGSAGPCAYDGDDFPRVGAMRFDAADLETLQQRGTLEAVILHEMGHVIGIGTSWRSRFNLVAGLTGSDPEYTGAEGIIGHELIGAARGSRPKVANTGGAGTRGGHWREATYGDELMTGFLSGNQQPMSALTINSLKDLGYVVDISAADDFSVSRQANTAEYASKIQSRMNEGETYGDDIFKPETIYEFDSNGGFSERAVEQPEQADDSTTVLMASAIGVIAVGTAMVVGTVMYNVRKNKKSSDSTLEQFANTGATVPSARKFDAQNL